MFSGVVNFVNLHALVITYWTESTRQKEKLREELDRYMCCDS